MTQIYLIDEIDKATTSPSTDIDKLTGAHDAHRSNFSGISDPTIAIPYQIYADTINDVYKQRNSGDTAWNIISSATDTPVISKNADYTAVLSDYAGLILVDASSAAVTITLPTSASTGNGWNVVVKKIDSSDNAVIIASSDNIDGTTTVAILSENAAINVRTNGSTYSVYNSSISNIVGNLVHLQQYTPTSVSELDITSLITSIYDNYVLRFSLSFSVAGDGLQLTASTNNGSTFLSTGYAYAFHYNIDDGTQNTDNGTNDSQWDVIPNVTIGVSASATDLSVGEISLYHMLNTSVNTILRLESNYTSTTGNFVNLQGGGRLTNVAAVNALKLSMITSTGGVFSGVVDFFGIAK